MATMTPSLQTARQSESTATKGRTLLRKCACGGKKTDDEKRQSPLLQRKAQGPIDDDLAPAIVEQALRSGGEALPDEVREQFESSFGHSFSQVRIHTGGLAAQSARAVGARAFTVGSDIVFNHSEFQPDNPSGRHLLAHELTHVVQQSALPAHAGALKIGQPDSGFEREADRVADRVSHAPAPLSSTAGSLSNGLPRVSIGGISAAPAAVQRVGECAGRTFRAGNCTGTPCRSATNRPGTCRWMGGNGCLCIEQYNPGPSVPVPAPAPAPNRDEESTARSRLPAWVVPLLSVAALIAVGACFATGVCEIGGLILAAGAATAAVLVSVLRAAGVTVNEGGGETA